MQSRTWASSVRAILARPMDEQTLSVEPLASATPVARSFEDLISFARECVSGGGFKKSDVIAFMRELVAIADSAASAQSVEHSSEPITDALVHDHAAPAVQPSLELERTLEHYASAPGRVKPETTKTGAIYLPLEANGFYTRDQALRLAGLLVRHAR